MSNPPKIKFVTKKQPGFLSDVYVRWNVTASIGKHDYYFAIDVEKKVPEGEQKNTAYLIFKNLVAEIAKQASD